MKNKRFNFVFILARVTFLITLSFVYGSAQTIKSTHFPLHPQNDEAVNFSVRIKSESGIKKLTLEVFEYETFKNNLEIRDIKPRIGGLNGKLEEWNFDVAQQNIEKTYSYRKGFPSATFLDYRFTFTDLNGKSFSQNVKTQAGQSPFGNDEILIYSTSDFLPARRINVCFIPDSKTYPGSVLPFIKNLETLIYDGYLMNNMIGNHSEYWAFYYTPSKADAKDKDIPIHLQQHKIIDVFGFIHNREFRDSRIGTRFSTEFGNVGTAVHETGHAVFNLSDEYNGSKSLSQACNLYLNKKECEDNENATCYQRNHNNGKKYYTAEDNAPNCVMNSDGDSRIQDFQHTCQRCTRNYYDSLSTTNKKFDKTSSAGFFGVEKLLTFNLKYVDGKLSIESVNATYGSPTKEVPNSKFLIEFRDSTKNLISSLRIMPPNYTFIERGNKVVENKQAFFSVSIPFQESVSNIKTTDEISNKIFDLMVNVNQRIDVLKN